MDLCVFCTIINKKLPIEVIFEDDNFLAFLPIEQISRGHTLLIPKKHYENVFDIDTTILQQLASTAQTISKELTIKYGASGINLLHASGKDAQQSVFHFHLHIVPRHQGDGLDLWFRNTL